MVPTAHNETAVYLGDKIIAQAMNEDLEKVEDRWYFPETALVDRHRFTLSETHTTCPFKGEASYYNYETEDGKIIEDVAWFYPSPKPGAEAVLNRVSFYIGRIPGMRLAEPPVA
ncbi:hypothetical protein JCM24511_05962 [Saitozyma sp. JCM 24511]|nr:hypothetical protein JCM24511_05962 [Saitozyma sp. JCM 24511]